MVASFIPETYVAPSSGGSGRFLKFEEGETTRFRILSERPLMGYVYWTTENRPKRSLEKPTDLSDAKRYDDGKTDKPKHFWAMVVWDCGSKEIKVLEVTQRSIQDELIKYSKHPEYGHPLNYDLYVSRSGKGLETKYEVIPARQNTPLSDEIKEAMIETPINLNALLVNGDPFNPPANTPVIHFDTGIPSRVKHLIKLCGFKAPRVREICEAVGLPADSSKFTSLEQLLCFRSILFSEWAADKDVDTTIYADVLDSLPTDDDVKAFTQWEDVVLGELDAKNKPAPASKLTPEPNYDAIPF